ncbi:MAG: Fur family transcriptional regulator [Sulfurovum sp.]|jgi:Fur family peroxide stress response transcriptional regulator
MNNYTTLLKEYDLKVTPQRIAIVEELYKNGHMNIDDLYKKLLDKFPSISLATIYKNVNSMIEKLFIAEVKIPNTKSVYELIKAEHAHCVCSSCGKIEDVEIDVENALGQLSNINTFKVDSVDLIFTGTCENCSK